MTTNKYDTHTEIQRLRDEKGTLIGKCAGMSAIVGIEAVGILLLAIGHLQKDEMLLERANRAAMVIYEPVGNGGALAAMSGYPNPRRDAMHERMAKVYSAVLDEPRAEYK